jgi:hypothetical protein
MVLREDFHNSIFIFGQGASNSTLEPAKLKIKLDLLQLNNRRPLWCTPTQLRFSGD